MAKDKETIKKNIEQFKQKNGGDYPEYYIGITNDPDRRLMEDLENEKLNEHIKAGIYDAEGEVCVEDAETNKIAREIEVYFQDLGMQKYNPRSKGIESSRFIYCFKIAQDSQVLTEDKEPELSGNSEEGKEMSRHIKKFKDFKP